MASERPAQGNYSVFVKCQDFGIIESGWTAGGNYGRKRKSPHTFAHIQQFSTQFLELGSLCAPVAYTDFVRLKHVY